MDLQVLWLRLGWGSDRQKRKEHVKSQGKRNGMRCAGSMNKYAVHGLSTGRALMEKEREMELIRKAVSTS